MYADRPRQSYLLTIERLQKGIDMTTQREKHIFQALPLKQTRIIRHLIERIHLKCEPTGHTFKQQRYVLCNKPISLWHDKMLYDTLVTLISIGLRRVTACASPALDVAACAENLYEGKKSWGRLTWHDPLADQFLSCASLLEFELEDCIETEEKRADENKKNQKSWAVPRVSTQQRSIYRVQIYSEAQELKYKAGIRSQFILPFRGSSFTLFFLRLQKAGARRAWTALLTHFLFLSCSPPCVWQVCAMHYKQCNKHWSGKKK